MRRLVEVPFGLNRPTWVDGPHLDLDREIRPVGVPAPGGPREFGALVGDLLAYKLDPGCPLWKVWFIEGLEDGRVAVLTKMHHCLADRVRGDRLYEVLCDLEPGAPLDRPDTLVLRGERIPPGWETALPSPLIADSQMSQRPGSVGKPIEGAAVRVVDNGGNGLPANQVGEVLIRIGGGRRFYFGEPESTTQTWQHGWVHTGDLGYLDTEGFVYVVDRKKDMIIRGGYNIYSIEVENALYEHPAIVEAAVLGVPHEVLGQDVLAVVRLAEGASLDLGALHVFLADRLADYKHPHRLVVAQGPLPRTSLDKVDKLVLRSELELDFRQTGRSGAQEHP